MRKLLKCAGLAGVASMLAAVQVGCNSGARAGDGTAAAPMNTTQADSITAPEDTMAAQPRDSAVTTSPVAPAQPEVARDTPPSSAAQPTGPAGGGELKVSQTEYEGWRQYSVNCARCHGQDALPNPVAANLLISLAPGGIIDSYDKFFQVVNEGRLERGMPAFKDLLTENQIKAIYAYLKGRAEKRIPLGRPASPSA